MGLSTNKGQKEGVVSLLGEDCGDLRGSAQRLEQLGPRAVFFPKPVMGSECRTSVGTALQIYLEYGCLTSREF